MTYISLISIPSVILWAFGIPIFALVLLCKYKKILLLGEERFLTKSEHNQLLETKVKYGFMFGGYRP